ncbi:MAG: pentapeptide repeat-containing protein [Thainema sp.]
MTHSGLSLRHPIKVWNRPLKANFKDLFKALGSGGINAATGQWAGLGKDLIDASVAVGLGNDPGQIAWLLIYRTLAKAMESLIAESQDLMEQRPEDLDQLCDHLDLSLEESELTIDAHFFEQPKSLPILVDLQVPLTQFLAPFLANPQQAEAIAARLPSYFVFALEQEWRSRSSEYAILVDSLATPFTQAVRQEQEWRLYRAWLQKQIDEPMFLEPFGLRQIYVSQLAYYRQQQEEKLVSYSSSGKRHERVVIDLEDDLNQWLSTAARNDAIRIISGGPGSGKSSFAKIFAAHQAEHGRSVLFIPLHQFDPSGDLETAVANFIHYDSYLDTSPLNPKQLNATNRLLIIFDGLDELAMQGRIAKEVAQGFIREVQKNVDRYNQRELVLQVLITGREIVVQDNSSEFRQPRQVLHLLPYFMPEAKREKDGDDVYVDHEQRLAQDRRQNWWQLYGSISGQGYTGLPAELDRGNLVEITSQPLLNYLVALSYTSGKLVFTAETNLNEIYFSLLKAVYERGYERNRNVTVHATIQGMKESDFIRILEEIALASWHGDGRTTTVKEIENHCDTSGLRRLLTVFEEGAQTGVTRLLAAFYFRQSGGVRDGERTFEFTHKSFGEYLTARRIVRCIARIHSKMNESDIDECWDAHQALVHWAQVCASPTRMSSYLFDFLKDEAKLQTTETLVKWQQTLVHLVNRMIRSWMPMEELTPRGTFRSEAIRSRHAEEALFAALHACAHVTKHPSNIDWPWPQSFGGLIRVLQGQRINQDDVSIIIQSLDYLNLSNCTLIAQDLYNANLCGTDLKNSDLTNINLRRAKLYDVSLVKANLKRASLSEARLKNVDLSSSLLYEANFSGAFLQKANFSSTNSQHTDFSYAHLNEANFQNAKLNGADFCNSDLSGADLSGADLEGVNFNGTILLSTDLRKAQNLSSSQLAGENRPYLCNVALPSDITDIDPNRDCARLPDTIADWYGWDEEIGLETVEYHLQKQWE